MSTLFVRLSADEDAELSRVHARLAVAFPGRSIRRQDVVRMLIHESDRARSVDAAGSPREDP